LWMGRGNARLNWPRIEWSITMARPQSRCKPTRTARAPGTKLSSPCPEEAPQADIQLGYYPADNQTNAYCANVRRSLSCFAGVHGFSFVAAGKARLRAALGSAGPALPPGKLDVVVINWIENGLIDRHGRLSRAGR